MLWKLGIVLIVTVILVGAACWQIQRGRRAGPKDRPVQTDDPSAASANLPTASIHEKIDLGSESEKTPTSLPEAVELEIDLARLYEALLQDEPFDSFPSGQSATDDDAASERRMNIERGMKVDELQRRHLYPGRLPEPQPQDGKFEIIIDPKSETPKFTPIPKSLNP